MKNKTYLKKITDLQKRATDKKVKVALNLVSDLKELDKQQREFHSVTMPDYMIMNYEAIVWTNFTDQMNRIIEKINFSDGSYWGEPGKFKFRASIDSFQDASEYEQERLIRTNFSFTFNGYLLPEEFNGVSNTQRGFSPKYISFGTETTLDINSRVRSVESDKSDGSGYNFNTPSIVNQS